MGVWEDVVDIGDGIRGAVDDVPSFVESMLEGDVHGMVTDGRNIIDDVTGVADGLQNLGVSLGEVPRRYLGNFAKVADSKILAAAQFAIDGQKKLTGEGEPENGAVYRDSADRLDDAMNEMIDANRKDDRWDGAAAQMYQDVNDAHRRRTSGTAAADRDVASILATEAERVARTRNTLDETSQWLYDFGLATSWMMFVPPLIPTKVLADISAASASMLITGNAMGGLFQASLEMAAQIRAQLDSYDEAAEDTSGADTGCDGGVIAQRDDLAEKPTRISNPDEYKLPEFDPNYGPPATPYDSPTQSSAPASTPGASTATPPLPVTGPLPVAAPGSTAGTAPSPPPASHSSLSGTAFRSPAPTTAPRSTASSNQQPPRPPAPLSSRPISTDGSVARGSGANSGEKAPLPAAAPPPPVTATATRGAPANGE